VDQPAQFFSSYVSWLALMWRDLELMLERRAWLPFRGEALLAVRLELLLMERAAARCLARGDLDIAQHGRISALLKDLGSLLDPGPEPSPAPGFARVHAAQDRIFDEVLAVSDRGEPELPAGRSHAGHCTDPWSRGGDNAALVRTELDAVLQIQIQHLT
jgi:hypothetical protein